MQDSTIAKLTEVHAALQQRLGANPSLIGPLTGAVGELVAALMLHRPGQEIIDKAYELASLALQFAEQHQQPPKP